MLKENKIFAAQTLIETANGIQSGKYDNYEDILNENSDLASGLIETAVIAALLAITTTVSVIAGKIEMNKYYKKIAKESVAVTREELHDAYEYLITIEDKIKAIIKSSKYKKYIDQDVIEIAKTSEFIDTSTQLTGQFKNIPFKTAYNLFKINLIELSKLQKKYDEIVVSNDRLNNYIKEETKTIAKLCDSVRDLVNKNKFMKDHFQCILVFNDSKSVAYCRLVLKHTLILNTSKYLKTK